MAITVTQSIKNVKSPLTLSQSSIVTGTIFLAQSFNALPSHASSTVTFALPSAGSVGLSWQASTEINVNVLGLVA